MVDILVEIGTRIDVQYQDKEYTYGVRAGIYYKDEAGGSHEHAIAYSWENAWNKTIIRYRVCRPLNAEETLLAKIKVLLK